MNSTAVLPGLGEIGTTGSFLDNFSTLAKEKFKTREQKKSTVAVKEILIVEDDPNNAELMVSLLEFHGIKGFVAVNSREAMEYVESNTPLLIMMDIGLSGTNGLELTHMMKQNQKLDSVPVVAVTAHASDRMRDLAEEAGCSGFICKPWSPEEIMAVIKEKCKM